MALTLAPPLQRGNSAQNQKSKQLFIKIISLLEKDKRMRALLNSEQNAKVCDATKAK